MKIAIIAAMSKELALLLPLIDSPSTITANGMTFHKGRIGNHEIIATECGIGKVNAAVGALTLIECFHPDMVINTGVAGGTGAGASILDVVVADSVAYHDVWCGPGTVPGQAASCPEKFDCPLPDSVFDGMDVKRGLVASGDIFVSKPEEVTKILSVWPEAMAVDMESAAIAQVCYLKSVPFVCIRVISDTPGSADNISQYENFWSDAPAHTFATLNSLLHRL
ncbi:MAG: 5'-methylthioadenosine/adenosylhomocysteine nucleosidase [Muribaculaceae bacterium]|nr:5'-methylthioadenosine/adenosylhomocysteine nucleosidase [Muribaculaceae bacterium]